jgi:hypothetical protein
MFHLDVSKVNLVLHMLQWLYTHVSSVSSIFIRMLYMFHLDVSKVNRMLHMLQMAPVAGGERLATRRQLLSRAFLARRASPSLLLSIPFPPSRHGSSSST